ncbi:hypothetical protein OKS68_15230 [Aeromonas veronii]|uniref:hypothetical protein n=1 Tax=Aeromonas veronii TaxID=654 RepID=UPI00226CFD02|nr:hypothetical protein [Aeromonas veronii]MCX9133826.1 hypothetical protein [Aeromonas veronii]
MRKNKSKKIKYDKVKTLSPKTFPPEYEDLTRSLYAKACQGSRHLWDRITTPHELKSNEELREQLYSAAHQGMMSAQDDIISIIQNDEKLNPSKELLLRGIADSIAWQILGYQLAHAKRFYKSNVQPDLYNSNFESVVFASRESLKYKPNAVSLISDLTSFIQIGDLLEYAPKKGLTIIEVKEGSMNTKICNFMQSYMQSPCDQALHIFTQKEGEQASKQLQRMLRQASRMSYVTSVLRTGNGIDPDTNTEIKIPEPYFIIENWDEELNNSLEKSHDNGWAIEVIDNCLFLGAYASDNMKISGHIIFNLWFDKMGATPECPRARLIDCMHIPLALPIFNRRIPDTYKFDLLFGRKQVCMGICIDSFLNECQKDGLLVRFATRKEQGYFDQSGNRPYRHKGKAIFIGNGKNEIVLMSGLFLRIMFHGEKPLSLIKTILDNIEVE